MCLVTGEAYFIHMLFFGFLSMRIIITNQMIEWSLFLESETQYMRRCDKNYSQKVQLSWLGSKAAERVVKRGYWTTDQFLRNPVKVETVTNY